ncbi:MAG TPA: ABC transporter permease, partial [Acidimicrobiales bacterium]|nr:ABC transporter permease [Acidimicrobiales bacterium]
MLEPSRPSPGPLPGAPEPRPGTSAELAEFGVEVRSQWRLVLGRFLRHRLALGSLALLVALVVVAFLGPHLSQHQYGQPGPDRSQPPSIHHWFGTNELGIDTFAQVQRGAQRSIQVAFLVAFLSTTFGSLVGALAGFYRGWLDAVLMRMTDLFLTIPTLAVLLVVAARFRNSPHSWLAIVLIIAAFTWMPLARLVRGVTLSLREREFVEAARAVGASNSRIIFRHILPNSLGPIIVNGTLVVAGAILVETALSFLGFGIQPPDVSLGLLISNGVQAANTRWW